MNKKILCVLSTRPEVIKMAPLIFGFKKDKEIDLTVLSLGQHREMLDQMLNTFGIVPDFDINIMKKKQTLPQLTANLAVPLDSMLGIIKPDFVLAQGDTTSAFMTSLACAYRRIPFGHVEAGLRTGNFDHPFPEEINRVLISRLAALHFAPTEKVLQNLLNEGIPSKCIVVTGNTVIDALQWILKKKQAIDSRIDKKKKLILVTMHRHENWKKLVKICKAVRDIVDNNKEYQVFLPVHPNPHVLETVLEALGNHPRIILSEPVDYGSFIALMKEAYIILSDSGGVQEEAPALGVPVLIMRKHTERMEGVELGYARLIGTDYKKIVEATQDILDHPEKRRQMIGKTSPYGDGKASARIIKAVKAYLEKRKAV